MRGILIDPFTRTISETDGDGSLSDIYQTLLISAITAVRVMDDYMYLDDEGLLLPKEEQEYFTMRGYNQPYAGRALIFGSTDDGDNTDTNLTVEEIGAMVEFIDKETINPDDYTGWTIVTF